MSPDLDEVALTIPDLGGRPEVDIDYTVVERAAAIGCNIEEISSLVGCTRRTIHNRVKTDERLAEALHRGKDGGAVTLRRKQWHNAMAGSDTMLIWLGKQLLKQRDYKHLDQEVTLRALPAAPYNPAQLTEEQRRVMEDVLLLGSQTIEGDPVEDSEE